MKSIAVVAGRIEYARHLRDDLLRFFGDYAEIGCYSIEELRNVDAIREDLVIVSAFTIFQAVRDKIRGDAEMIVASIVVNTDNLAPLAAFPEGTRALLCNIDYRTCMQVISELYMAGHRNLELTPYYGGGGHDPSIKLAVTPDEPDMVPPGIEKVVDIGQRVIDLNCIYDIAVRLGVGEEFVSNETVRRQARSQNAGSSIERVLGEHGSLAEQITVLLTLIPKGILITNAAGVICLSNGKAGKLLEKRSEVLEGFALRDVLPELDDHAPQMRKGGLKHLVIDIEGQNTVISTTAITRGGEVAGTVVTLDNFDEQEEIQHGIRSKLSRVEHRTRYRFEDVKGRSAAILDAVATAKRLAKSDSSILIVGESGTGKELFAQSIHGESPRRDYNFVAVNCAAIPGTLLESEMFGYEEGSFTGARKGGRAGYFELSHKGTIFLDEIAELPLPLQAKLLRVIEERKIIKIGSHKIVDVDVRIVAATNKNLFEMVERGLFREDLYYRLNVLPLRLPSLRERPDDIPVLVEHFRARRGFDFVLDADSVGEIVSRPWRGNIRELRNLVEYLGSLNKSAIAPSDLPLPPERRQATGQAVPAVVADNPLFRSFVLKEGRRLELHAFILRELQAADARRERLGRKRLLEAAEKGGRFHTEAEIRSALKRLDEYGFIEIGKGRGGSRITQEGKSVLQWHKKAFLVNY